MTVVLGIAIVILLFVASVFVVYDIIFSNNKKYMGNDNSLPHGEQYDPYHGTITKCVEEVLGVPYEKVTIESDDGLTLVGKYYHLNDDAPVIIFFHGYRCSGIRDGNGMFLYTRKLGFNVLLVDLIAKFLCKASIS